MNYIEVMKVKQGLTNLIKTKDIDGMLAFICAFNLREIERISEIVNKKFDFKGNPLVEEYSAAEKEFAENFMKRNENTIETIKETKDKNMEAELQNLFENEKEAFKKEKFPNIIKLEQETTIEYNNFIQNEDFQDGFRKIKMDMLKAVKLENGSIMIDLLPIIEE
jgi:hypothetical protein